MSSKKADDGLTGRERLEAMRAEEARKGKQRKILSLIAALVVVALVAVGAMWMITNNNKSDENTKAEQGTKDSAYIKTMTSIPASTFDKVGTGTAKPEFQQLTGSQPMTENGKPRILYVGGEFCPFCGMERWSLVAALSRFGEFSGLQPQLSSANEGQLSNIPTVTFRNAKYTSKYIVFKPYETTDRDHNALQKMSASDEALFNKFNPEGGIPWVDWAGEVASGTAFVDMTMPGKTGADIAKALQDPGNATTKNIIGAANIQTAQICKLTKNQPANVCNSAGVKAAAAKL